ncbi:hypothetical protein PC129_g17943 [Phytophthora cactorum]|uniref:Uncharacterized protein n=1 Tax=Phytophthora cactorum TaxID=29920 RepID=A0A8T0YMX6_9STRA|nr:hypothetical protein PC113_g18250 [Phytophthora cactorum]KAG2886089.1 hypothetical protein PC114_g19447 [Phytophthora cactorum]KAG3211065.1 hypothetical protein PC129_g17943 [Phytophthora cactorum]
MAEPTQRKNFSEAVDGMLLKQTIADEPYKQEHDKVMKQWDRVLESPGFCEELGGFENYSGWLGSFF